MAKNKLLLSSKFKKNYRWEPLPFGRVDRIQDVMEVKRGVLAHAGNRPELSKVVRRKGSRSARVDLDVYKSDTPYRTEFKVGNFAATFNEHYWYAFSHYFPSDYVTDDSIWEIFAQWMRVQDKGEGDEEWGPQMSLRNNVGTMEVALNWGPSSQANRTSWPVGPIKPGQWTDWVFHVVWSHTAGLLEVFRDKVLVVTRKGPNAYDDAKGPFWKVGLYRGSGKSPPYKVDKVSRRTICVDCLKVATGENLLDKISP